MQDLTNIFPIILPTLFIACIILNFILGYVVFQSNKQSATNRLFALTVVALSAWLIVFVISLRPFSPEISLWWIRWSMLLATPINTLFLFLAYTFPHTSFGMKKHWLIITIVSTAFVALVNITPYTFTHVAIIDGFPKPVPGAGLALFTVFVIGTNIATFAKMIERLRTSSGDERKRISLFLWATAVFLAAMFGTVLMPNLLFSQSAMVVLAPVYALGFISTVAYASFRHHLFDVKVIATQVFVLILSIVLLLQIFSSENSANWVIDTIIFVAAGFFGILLIRSVKKEIRQRDEIAGLANQLAKTNRELAKKNEELRIIDQRKSEFVSIVSHQLRTPITAIRGYASLLLENAYGTLPKEFIEPIEKISASSRRIAEMVSDFLDISKIEQGTMTYHFTTVALKALLTDLIKEFRTVAEKKHLSIDLHFATEGEFFVRADEGKIRQIFSNLLDNAIKYTPEGRIDVTLTMDTTTNMITIEVKDIGIGLSQDDIHHLFGKFTRGQQGQRSNTEGSGLGLYIAKKMLEAHNGKIWVDSEGPGRGTRFVVELPAEKQP